MLGLFRRMRRSASLQAGSVDEVVPGHFLGLGEAHDMEDGGGDVGEDAVVGAGGLVVGDVYEGHGVEGVGGVGCAVGVLGMVGVAVVGDDDHFIVAGCFGGLDYVAEAVVECLDGLLDG